MVGSTLQSVAQVDVFAEARSCQQLFVVMMECAQAHF